MNKDKKWEARDQEVEALDSSFEEDQRARRFFKIGENGLAKELTTINSKSKNK